MQRRWLEPRFLSLFLGAAGALWLFLGLASEVGEGETATLDRAILLALRPQNHPDGPFGPRWLQELVRDMTSLGSIGVLSFVVVSTFLYLLLVRQIRLAFFILFATFFGGVANVLLKAYFDRRRPDIFPHDFYVQSTSFPSGHAMLATTVYLTLGALLARLAPNLRSKIFILSLAAFLSGLVGLSRIFLAVHWPSDVLAGWAAGAAWALGAWTIAQLLQPTPST